MIIWFPFEYHVIWNFGHSSNSTMFRLFFKRIHHFNAYKDVKIKIIVTHRFCCDIHIVRFKSISEPLIVNIRIKMEFYSTFIDSPSFDIELNHITHSFHKLAQHWNIFVPFVWYDRLNKPVKNIHQKIAFCWRLKNRFPHFSAIFFCVGFMFIYLFIFFSLYFVFSLIFYVCKRR